MFKIEDLIKAHERIAARGVQHIEHIIPAGELFGIDPILYDLWKGQKFFASQPKQSLVIKYIRVKK